MPPKKSTRKKSTRKKSQTGRGILSTALKFAKDKKLLSKGLLMIPHPAAQTAGSIAQMLGLGRKKRSGTRKRSTTSKRSGTLKRVTLRTVPVRRSRNAMPISSAAIAQLRGASGQYGRGIFSDLGGGIGSVFGGLGGGIGSVARGLFGGARSKRTRRSTRK